MGFINQLITGGRGAPHCKVDNTLLDVQTYRGRTAAWLAAEMTIAADRCVGYDHMCRGQKLN